MDISPDLPRRNIVRILINQLKSIKQLKRTGFSAKKSEAIVSMISNAEIHNLYSKEEIDVLLRKTTEEILAKQQERLVTYMETRTTETVDVNSMFEFFQNESRELRKEQAANFCGKFSKLQDEVKSFLRWLIFAVSFTVITIAIVAPVLEKLIS